MTVLRKSFYIHWSAGRSPRVHEVNPGRDPSALICLGLLNRGARPKATVPIIPPLFPAEEISIPWLEKYHILDLLVVGNGGPLMLMCSNVRVTEGFSIFANTFNAAFWGFPQV